MASQAVEAIKMIEAASAHFVQGDSVAGQQRLRDAIVLLMHIQQAHMRREDDTLHGLAAATWVHQLNELSNRLAELEAHWRRFTGDARANLPPNEPPPLESEEARNKRLAQAQADAKFLARHGKG